MASFVALAPDKSCLSGTLDGLKWHKELMMVLRTKARSNMYQEKNEIFVNLVPLVVLATLVILVIMVNLVLYCM